MEIPLNAFRPPTTNYDEVPFAFASRAAATATLVFGMALNPHKLHTGRSTLPVALAVTLIVFVVNAVSIHTVSVFQHLNNLDDQILVLNSLACRVLPVVGAPFLEPDGHTVDGVVAVTVDDDLAVPRRKFQGSLESSELRTLVGLTCSCQSLAEVAPITGSKVDANASDGTKLPVSE
jgi:hypothetical protein